MKMEEASSPPPAKGLFSRPGALAALALALGHAWAWALALGHWAPGALAASLGALLAVCAPFRSPLFVLGWCLAFAGLGAMQEADVAASDRRALSALRSAFPGGAPFASAEGTASALPLRTASSWIVMLEDAAVSSRGQSAHAPAVALRVKRSDPADALFASVVSGDRIAASGALLDVADAPGQGESQDWFRELGAAAVLRASTATRTAPAHDAAAAIRRAALATANATERFLRTALPQQDAALLLALTVGRTDLVAPERHRAWQRTGLLHVFSVSGFHTALLGAVLLWLLRIFGIGVRWRLLLLAAAMGYFALVVGARLPVIRSAMMLLVFEAEALLRRPAEPLAALGTIAALLMAAFPRAVWQADFQLTFLCILAIIAAGPWIVELRMALGARLGWGRAARWCIRAAEILAVSAAVQLAILPVLLARTGEISLVSPIANLLVLPLSACMVAALAILALAAGLPDPASAAMSLLEYPLRAVESAVQALAALPAASLPAGEMPAWAAASYYAVLLGAAWMRLRRTAEPRRPAAAFAIPALLVLLAFLGGALLRPRPGELRVWFLDVGQGDAILVRTPDGRSALVDAGPDAAAPQLAARLRERGVSALEFAVATHADADHIGGLAEVLAEFPCRTLFVGGSVSATAEFDEVRRVAEERGIAVVQVARGAAIEFGNPAVVARVLHPTPEFAALGLARNDASVVLRLEYAGRSILLAGDAEAAAEADMIAAGVLEPADVLKAGHHGSASSTTAPFLAALRPRAAVISCGAANRYGHPAPAVLQRLAPARVLRTDRMGTILLRIAPGGALSFESARTIGSERAGAPLSN